MPERKLASSGEAYKPSEYTKENARAHDGAVLETSFTRLHRRLIRAFSKRTYSSLITDL